MPEVLRFEAADGVAVLVEADDPAYGMQRATRGADGIVEATHRLQAALVSARSTVAAAIDALSGLGLDEMSVEFGVKLSAEAGALIAKTAAEGHLKVVAKWTRPPDPGGTGG